MNAPMVLARAAGPLGALVQTDRSRLHGRTDYELAAGANPLVLLYRVAFVTSSGTFDTEAERCLLVWAKEHRLGQEPELVRLAAARRARAMSAARHRRGVGVHQRLTVRPQWRIAVGLGNRANPYEIGLSLHGTYGWPVIPGSTVKGVTCAWAVAYGAAQTDPTRFAAVFGLPRVGQKPAGFDGDGSAPKDRGAKAGEEPRARTGTVTFFDALPLDEPVAVTRDVVTPHVQPYYKDRPEPPAEHHNPIPSEFLVVSGGAFAIDLVGPADDVAAAAQWCQSAVEELGVGAKTSSGYGYLVVDE